MPAVKTPQFVEHLKNALLDHLKEASIPAKVKYERIPSTRLYRFTVLAPKFRALRHTERQSLVWRIAEAALPVDEQLLVSMILTLTPEEAKELGLRP